MDTYAIYRLLKDYLKETATVFFYTGQYLRDKNKTVYKVPAIYIQMPAGEMPVSNFGQIRFVKGAQIRIHYISHAPHGTVENQVQDSAVKAHASKVLEIINLLSGSEHKDANGRLVAGQCIVTGIESVSYTETFARSVVRLSVDLYDYSGVTKIKVTKAI
jgi:hypothetical protein